MIDIDNPTNEDFHVWAFGKKVWDKWMILEADSMALLDSWNDLHGHELTIDENEDIYTSLEKMEKLWETHGKKH